jgi:NAD dependent epimerase/dehydratase family enzyme
MKEIGKVLRRPVFLPNIPAIFIKIMMGERSILILGSQKISADLILSKGFKFHYYFLSEALRDIFNNKG